MLSCTTGRVALPTTKAASCTICILYRTPSINSDLKFIAIVLKVLFAIFFVLIVLILRSSRFGPLTPASTLGIAHGLATPPGPGFLAFLPSKPQTLW